MQTLTQIKAILEEHGLRPNKALGQNFLCDHNLLKRLIEASGVGPGDLVLEVGPGTGTMTEALLERGAEVVACEIDRGLAQLLSERLAGFGEQFRIVQGDCLGGKRSLNGRLVEAIGNRSFRLVANLPYGAASSLIALLATEHHPSVAAGRAACIGQFVTVQREVAERLAAGPGGKDYGELSIVVRAMCEVRLVATLGPECFWPRPKVTSRMVAITPRARPLTDRPSEVSAACRLLFAQRRKQIGSVLGKARLALIKLPVGVEARMRAEQLSLEQLVELAGSLKAENADDAG